MQYPEIRVSAIIYWKNKCQKFGNFSLESLKFEEFV
jgi:hypothetical protein